MRDDWDRRAREDAGYYVAFGRRRQSREEFFASAQDVLRALKEELRRFPAGTDPRSLAALEIGCGPGRLMVPLSEVFGRIAGVDVSGEMVAIARENLKGIQHAEVRENSGSGLEGFADESFDFCYSYAVFQHIPDREVVYSYLREALRVLKKGGLLKFQFNGLPAAQDKWEGPLVDGWSRRSAVAESPAPRRAAAERDTWSGIGFRPEEIGRFAKEHHLQLLAMDGFNTQYLWVTARKRHAGWGREGLKPAQAEIVRVTNTVSGEPVVPCSGPFASGCLWVLNLDDNADLNRLVVEVDGVPTAPCFLGKHVGEGPTQVNFYLPPGVRSGVLPVSLRLDGRKISGKAPMRVIGEGPLVPRVVDVSDGVNLLSKLSIESRAIKVSLEEVPAGSAEALLGKVQADLDGQLCEEMEAFLVDPLSRRFELNLPVPPSVSPGPHRLTIRLGRRALPAVGIHIAE